ncbi:MAG: CHAT domain-containing protein [Gammaproteobacteria bacterium]|nr:CHAT domain-containing protein [Gammaproteobacteria bacterium]
MASRHIAGRARRSSSARARASRSATAAAGPGPQSGTLRLRGQPVAPAPAPHAESIEIVSRGRVQLGAARAAAGAVDVSIRQDDVACLEYSNGFRQWLRVDDLHREFGTRASRGGDEEGIWEVDPSVRAEAGDGAVQRGVGGLVVEALEVFGVDLKRKTAVGLSQWFERRQLHGNAPGIYRVGLGDALSLEAVTGRLPATGPGQPLLLLVHGTASSAAGSFASLWNPSNKAGAALRKALQGRYGRHVYAFEHRSLTVSPIDNAAELVEKFLPEDAELHLVTHSRGGLIADLLCLAQRVQGRNDPLQPGALDRLFGRDRTLGAMLGLGRRDSAEAAKAYAVERARLLELIEALKRRRPRVTRLVRVACPARGTTLASGRLDRWLSVIQHFASEMIGDALDFLLAVVQERTDPRSLPGLEAMMPGSALIRLLNHPDLRTAADLSVIAGDIEGDSFWGKLKLVMADWFYASDHDLVVNTGSMYGGLQRTPGAGRFFLDQGREVSHFHYFANERTVRMLQEGLLRADGALAGFRPIAEARPETPAWREAVARSAQRGPRPVVIVLPGTMGSELLLGSDCKWLDYLDLARGGLEDIGIEARRVVPGNLLDDFYGEFLAYLTGTHEVVPFAYDWRLSVATLADQLAPLVEARLTQCEGHRQPLRIAAHSMGGLVTRMMLARHRRLWERLRALPGSRFVMFGTPNAGSYEAVRWITGRNPTLGKLALLDITHDRDELLQIVTRFPGMLELLPEPGAGRDFGDVRFWQRLKAEVDEHWPVPPAAELRAVDAARRQLAQCPVDPAVMIYVAGCARHTVCDYRVVPAVRRPLLGDIPANVQFLSTRQGDGTVTWASGRLAGVPTWYVEDTQHDELLASPAAFPAYAELLSTGSTSRLPAAPPRARGVTDAEGLEVLPADLPDSVPDPQTDPAMALGPSRRRRRRAESVRLPRVKVSVRHGDLAYARNPVCVGHYLGDSIVSAEAALDKRLDGALTNRVRLGLYPGRLGTHEIFLDTSPAAKPGGAVVIGLGQVGELTPGALEAGMAQAMLDYALHVADCPDDRFGAHPAPRSARACALLIGTGFSNMSVRDSVAAMLWGVHAANHRLLETGFSSRVLIDEIEFLELYQDIAIQAVRALAEVLTDGELVQHVDWSADQGVVIEGQGGRRRATFEEGAEWWRRLEIGYDRDNNTLRFTHYGDRARAEQTLVSGQIRLAEDFIATACGSTANSREISRTLFEMLMPNGLKELAPAQHDMVYLVDERSAAFPWELMENRWGTNTRPLAVAAGMLRQLKTQEFRPAPAYTFERSAYIVGNPQLPAGGQSQLHFADLPGAEKEAQQVGEVLAASGFRATVKVRDSAENILMGLHADAYQILHLAGHGVHDAEVVAPEPGARTERVSGMVIGDNVYLTPGDIRQMRWVPELVFINCCHLGRTDGPAEASPHYNLLAASVAVEFIKMGVKAVIAAGWAVDDAAGRQFAVSFYRHMLGGAGFGHAVRAAREEVYTRFPQVNTWGAYQCYGDQDLHLVGGQADASGRPTPITAVSELVAKLDNCIGDVRMSGGEAARYRPKVEALLARVPPGARDGWLARPDVCASLGVLFGEAGDYEQALEYLDRLTTADRAEFPVRALEHRANIRVKRAFQRWREARGERGGSAAERQRLIAACRQEVAGAVAEIESLMRFGASAERRALLGSAHKRMAALQTDVKARVQALRDMARAYREAFVAVTPVAAEEQPLPRGAPGAAEPAVVPAPGRGRDLHAYSLTNWVTANLVLQWYRAPTDEGWQRALHAYCPIAVEQAAARERTDPSYWNSVVVPDCRLVAALAGGVIEDAEVAEIAAGYRAALERGSSRREFGSVLDHVEFVIEMARGAGQKQAVLCEQLERLAKALTD